MVRRVMVAGVTVSVVAGIVRLFVPHDNPWGALFLGLLPATVVLVAVCLGAVATVRPRVGPARLVPGQVAGLPALVAPSNRDYWVFLAAMPWMFVGMALPRIVDSDDGFGRLDIALRVLSIGVLAVSVLNLAVFALGRPVVGLREDGIANWSRLGGWVVPWSALGDPATIRPRDPGSFGALIELRVDHRDQVRFERFGRPRPAPARIQLGVRQFDVDGTFLADAIDNGMVPNQG